MANIVLNINHCPLRVDYYNSNSQYTSDIPNFSTLIMKPEGGVINTPYSASISIHNVGGASISIESIQIVSDPDDLFELTPDTTPPFEVLPNNDEDFTVDFSGTDMSGTYECLIYITYNINNTFTISLTITI